MNLVGKHTIQKFDRQNNLVDEQVSYNVITTKGRERILDIWAYNLRPDADPTLRKNIYGYEIIDTSPTEVTGGTRRCTTFGTGTMKDSRDDTDGRNYNAYDAWRNGGGEDVSDAIFDPRNEQIATWSGGPGDNANLLEYLHCIDLCRVDTEETLTVDYTIGDNLQNLIGSKIKFDYNSNKQNALKVWNATKTASYTINTDYTFDQVLGTITFIQSGTISDAQDVIVEYKWHDTTPFDDGVCGWSMYGFPRNSENALYHRSWISSGQFSTNMGEYFGRRCFPWDGRPAWHYRSYHTDGGDYIQDAYFNPRFSENNHEYEWLTYPHIMNSPTNMSFCAGFSYSPYYIRNWNFLKPKYQPQTPSVIAVGTGNTAASVSDTALETEAVRLDVFSSDRISNGLGKWKSFIDYDESSGITFKEVGLFHGDTWRETEDPGWTFMSPIKKENCNELFSRSVYDTPWSKSADERVELTYEILLT